MSRSATVRNEIQRLISARPFQRFLLTLESGDRVLIEHPVNMAYDPKGTESGSEEFYVIAGRLRLYNTFGAVTSITLADQEGRAA